jgi:polyisoprenoid-binding protein YceI
MKASLVALFVASSLLAADLAPGEGNVLELYVEKTGLLAGKKHRFLFDRFEGRFDESHVTMTIDAASIRCVDTWVSANDLKKIEKTARTEMLDVSRFPSLKFESTAIRQTAPDRFEVSGALTVRDRSRTVIVAVMKTGDRSYRGSAKIRLTDFGLKPPSAALGLVGTKDEMAFAFVLVERNNETP